LNTAEKTEINKETKRKRKRIKKTKEEEKKL
jgi:hypothetical protein